MNPVAFLLICAMLATATVLLIGIFGFIHGGSFNTRYGNKLMRARVALQFLAVMLLGLLLISQH
jgi:hypothetical protein